MNFPMIKWIIICFNSYDIFTSYIYIYIWAPSFKSFGSPPRFAFNSILLFLVKFGILPLNLVIRANQSFIQFLSFLFVLGVLLYYYLYALCSLQRQIRLLLIKIQTLSIISFFNGFQTYYPVNLRFTTKN